VRVFKYARFSRFTRKEDINDDELLNIVEQLEAGQSDADLGGGVFKMRIARSGEGKSGGYRVIVFFKSGERTFYVHGFAKSDTANISKKELVRAKKQAKTLFTMTDTQIQTALKEGVFEEIRRNYHEK
jgi:hypothetical protein